MWKEAKDPKTGKKHWEIDYHETVQFGVDGLVEQLDDGRFEASVAVCTDGGTYHDMRKEKFDTLKEAQQWCDTVWNSPENLPVRLQLCQMEILHSIDQTLDELLKLVDKRA